MSSSFALLPFLLALAVPPPAAEESGDGTLVLLVEAADLRRLEPESLDVFVDGRPVEVIAVEPLGPQLKGREPSLRRVAAELRRPWRFLIYLDPVFATRPLFYWTARDLAARAGELTALGTVEIVDVPGGEDAAPRVRLAATRDPQVVAAVLEEVSIETLNVPPESFGRQRQVRGAFLARKAEALRRLQAGGVAAANDVAREVRLMAREGAFLEGRAIERRLELVERWLTERASGPPSAFVWLVEGFDLEPEKFYAADLGDSALAAAIERDVAAFSTRRQADEVARRVAAAGWTAVTVGFRSERVTSPLGDFEAPLRRLAVVSAGLLLSDGDELSPALVGLARRWLVTCLAASDGADRRIEVRSEVPVRVPRWHRTLPPSSPARTARPQAVYLAPFAEPMVAGRVRVEPLVLEPGVESVDLYLDGERIDTLRGPDFRAWIRVEQIPVGHVLEAVALGPGGVELGRDRIAVNRGSNRFAVRLTSPGRISEPGELDVAADVLTPAGRRLERLEIYWNEELLATLNHPPWEGRVRLPSAKPGEYLRVLAVLDDGRTAEDTVSAGEEGFTERTEVELVEVYAVVEDASGRPVPGLQRESFTLLEDGNPQGLHAFGGGLDLPLHLGLMIDISQSMESAMPLVKSAAKSFLGQLISAADRSFLVVFHERPFLAQPSTGDLEVLSESIDRLSASGSTALWDSMIYSLLEFAGLPGRKALVVLTDGVDKGSGFAAGAAVQAACRTGVPVYVIGMTGIDGRGPWQHRGSLRRLADSTGGEVFFIAGAEELEATYGTIAEELRSQYYLAFQSDRPADEGGWRELTLETDRPGLAVRSVAGYFAWP